MLLHRLEPQRPARLLLHQTHRPVPNLVEPVHLHLGGVGDGVWVLGHAGLEQLLHKHGVLRVGEVDGCTPRERELEGGLDALAPSAHAHPACSRILFPVMVVMVALQVFLRIGVVVRELLRVVITEVRVVLCAGLGLVQQETAGVHVLLDAWRIGDHRELLAVRSWQLQHLVSFRGEKLAWWRCDFLRHKMKKIMQIKLKDT
mmetsp:Transcript_28084/g.53494  ORF Transcript_28084/g.53494 Transcript_28084/m.53494 type:complete len:202 (+) Transcript_28084:1287-1892(+)